MAEASAGHNMAMTSTSASVADLVVTSAPSSAGAAAASSRRVQPSRSAHLQSSTQQGSDARQTRGGVVVGSSRKTKYEPPRWARQFERIPSSSAPSNNGSADIAEEDFYLRCKAYKLASEIVDRAFVQAWADAIDGSKDGSSSSNDNDNTSCADVDQIEGGAMVRDLEAFFCRYRPQQYDDSSDINTRGKRIGPNDLVTPSKKRCLDTADDEITSSLNAIAEQASLLLQPYVRDPTILPLALLSVGPSVLDRAELVKLIYRGLARRKGAGGRNVVTETASASTTSKAAVCILRGGPYRTAATGKTFHGDLLREIVSQCIAQETHRSQYLHLLEVNRKSRFKHISYTERLIEWAGLTEEFDSIVVILEDPEALSHRTFDAFMATMTSLRACYGVPMGLVIASIDHVRGRTTLSRSSLDGIAGMDVQSFVSPPSDVVLDNLISKFFISADERISLPVVLESSTLRGIKANFADNNRSVVEAALQIKLALAHHFSQNGSFLSMAQSSTFTTSEWQRIAWFCVDKDARSYIMSSTSDSDMASSYCARRLRDMIWRKRIFALLNAWMKLAQSLLPSLGGIESNLLVDFRMVEGRLAQSAHFGELFEALCDFLMKLPLKDALGLLIDWKKEMNRHAASFKAADNAFKLVYEYIEDEGLSKGQGLVWRFLQEDLDSSIILFNSVQEASKGTGENRNGTSRELRAALVHSLEMRYRLLQDLNMPFSSDDIRRESRKCATSGVMSLLPQVRRSIARALASPPDLPDKDVSTTHDPVIVFQLMASRVVDIDEWYESFVEEIQVDSDGKGEIMWQRFVFAVQELEMCGLVSRSRRRGRNSFEKNAMVWSSGL